MLEDAQAGPAGEGVEQTSERACGSNTGRHRPPARRVPGRSRGRPRWGAKASRTAAGRSSLTAMSPAPSRRSTLVEVVDGVAVGRQQADDPRSRPASSSPAADGSGAPDAADGDSRCRPRTPLRSATPRPLRRAMRVDARPLSAATARLTSGAARAAARAARRIFDRPSQYVRAALHLTGGGAIGLRRRPCCSGSASGRSSGDMPARNSVGPLPPTRPAAGARVREQSTSRCRDSAHRKSETPTTTSRVASGADGEAEHATAGRRGAAGTRARAAGGRGPRPGWRPAAAARAGGAARRP